MQEKLGGHAVPAKGVVKYILFIVSEFCQLTMQKLISASALPVYQALTARQECLMLHTRVLHFHGAHQLLFNLTRSAVNDGLKLVPRRCMLFTVGGGGNSKLYLAYQLGISYGSMT